METVVRGEDNHLKAIARDQAHGRVVTSSCQITEVKQCRVRLVLGWVTGARHAAGHVLGKPLLS